MLMQRDPDLLRRFRDGDREAMSTVFTHYSDNVARYLTCGFAYDSDGRRFRFEGLRQRHDLHDAVAETFRRAFEESARRAYAGLSPYESYLRRIARNLVIDRLRSKASRWVALEEAPAAAEIDHGDPAPSPEQAAEHAELTQLIGAFMQELDRAERRFVSLRYQQGLSQEKVASTMRKSRRWVRTTELRVRQLLVKHMRDSGYVSAAGKSRRQGRAT